MISTSFDATHGINTASCFSCHGRFTFLLDRNAPLTLPHLSGVVRVGNRLRLSHALILYASRGMFRITIEDRYSFSVPAQAVLQVLDAEGAIISRRVS